jgi:hypothetical protein
LPYDYDGSFFPIHIHSIPGNFWRFSFIRCSSSISMCRRCMCLAGQCSTGLGLKIFVVLICNSRPFIFVLITFPIMLYPSLFDKLIYIA